MAEPEAAEKKKTPWDFLRPVFRRPGLFLISAALIASAAMLLSAWYWQLRYSGTAIFERRYDAAARRVSPKDPESFETIKLTLKHRLVGREAIGALFDDPKFPLYRGLPRDEHGHLTVQGRTEKQNRVRELTKQTEMRWLEKSPTLDQVSVTVTHDDPKLAQLIPNELVRRYIDQTGRKIVENLKKSKEWLSDQVKTHTNQLKELKDKRDDFNVRHAAMMLDRPGALENRIDDLRRNLDAIRRERAAAQSKAAQQRTLLGAGSATARRVTTAPATQPTQPSSRPVRKVRRPNPELKHLQDQLREAKDAVDTALTLGRMTDQHPTVKTLRAKVKQLEEKIKNTPKDIILEMETIYDRDDGGPNLAAQLAAMQLVGLLTEIDMKTNEIERLEQQAGDLGELSKRAVPIRQEFLERTREIEEKQAEVQRWQDQLTEVEMALAAEGASKRTHLYAVELAQEQTLPSEPRLLVVLGLALGGGLAFGAALAFLANVLDRSVATTEDAAEHFELPVHGVVGEILSARQRTARALKRWALYPVVSLVLALCVACSALSITLRLHYPHKYETWRRSPTVFIQREGMELLGDALESIGV